MVFAESHVAGIELEIFLPLLGMMSAMVGALVYLIRQSLGQKDDHDVVIHEVQHIAAAVDKLVEAQDAFQAKGWTTLPDDIGTSAALTSTIRDLQHDAAEVDKKLDIVIGELREHVAWELTQKYAE